MQRIVILGNAGSGKTTLAKILGERLKAPVIHMDVVFWQPGWTKPENDVFRAEVGRAIAGDRWVCEGNYARQTFDLRLPRADLVVWLDTPRLTCIFRVILRSLSRKRRAELPAGCAERFDATFLSFLRYVWNFDRETRPLIEAEQQRWREMCPVAHLRDRREIAAFLTAIHEP